MSVFTRLFRRYQSTAGKSAWEPTPPPSPSVMDGRRHLAQQPYALPKDVQEEQRVAFQHTALYTCLHRHAFAPLQSESVRSLLDVGCGSGVWLRDIARLFPGAQLIGLDSDRDQLPYAAALSPASCRFVQGDVLQGLPFADNTFDFTHMRCMVAAIPAHAWSAVVTELMRVTHPGGWVELFDGGQACKRVGPHMQQLLFWGQAAGKRLGFDPLVVEQLGTMLRQAGAGHVHEKCFSLPLGKWGGRGGDLMARDMQALFQTLKPVFSTTLPLAPEQVDATLLALPSEWEHFRTLYVYFLAYGQKDR